MGQCLAMIKPDTHALDDEAREFYNALLRQYLHLP